MLKQRFLVQFGSSVIIQIVGMVSGIIVARIAGPGVVGVVAYGTAYVSILGFINGLFGTAHIKLVSEGRNHPECMAVFARLRNISAFVYLIAIAGWFCFQKYILHYPFESREVQIVIVISLFANFFSQYQLYSSIIFTANLKQAKANIPNFFRTLAWHLGRIVIVVLGYRAVMLSSWNLLLSILFLPIIYKLLREYPLGKYNPILAKEYIRYALPNLISTIISSITTYADKLLLAYFSTTTQLGYYSAAYAIGGMFMLIAVPVGNIFFPLFSNMISKGDWEGVNTNIRKYHEFIVLFVFPLICILAIVARPSFLLVMGKRYEPSVNPFTILLFSTYIVLLGLPYGNIIAGMGKFYLLARMDFIKLVVFIISITIFISPRFLNLGATGLAFNQLVLSLSNNSIYLFFARKHGKVHLEFSNNIRHLVIFVFSITAFFLSGYLKEWSQFWWLIYIPGYFIIIYSILSLTGLIKREHWMMLLEAANLRKTINYINDEMKE